MKPHKIGIRMRTWFASIVWTAAVLFGSARTGVSQTADPVDFNRDVRPLLSRRCIACHGRDEASRQGGLRLDDRESATAAADSGEVPIVPGSPDASELLVRITSDDDDLRMPPADGHRA